MSTEIGRPEKFCAILQTVRIGGSKGTRLNLGVIFAGRIDVVVAAFATEILHTHAINTIIVIYRE